MSDPKEVSSNDIMVDLETTGVAGGCGILSLGACTFDLGYNFYDKISHESCLENGLVDLPSTIAWWDKQNPLARAEAFSGTKSLAEVLGAFADWYSSIPRTKFIWGNGADFDLPILQAAYDAVGMKKPWGPFNGRCYRTLKNLYPSISMGKFEGMKHNALDDAQMQARHALSILKERKRQNQIVASHDAQVPGIEINI